MKRLDDLRVATPARRPTSHHVTRANQAQAEQEEAGQIDVSSGRMAQRRAHLIGQDPDLRQVFL